jgi:hypothetical protein
MLQSKDATICDVIPFVLRLLNIWSKMEMNAEEQKFKDLCHLLCYYLKLKFKFELHDPIYQVRFQFLIKKL